jgi:hypothetical protein
MIDVCRKVVLAFLLTTAAAAAAWANDPLASAQQTVVGQVATELAPGQGSPAVEQQGSATVSSGSPAPEAKLGSPREPTAAAPSVGKQRAPPPTPLILGIRH